MEKLITLIKGRIEAYEIAYREGTWTDECTGALKELKYILKMALIFKITATHSQSANSEKEKTNE